MLFDTGISKSFWAEALTFACNLVNKFPSSAMGGKISLEVWSGRVAQDYDSLPAFGVLAYYHVKEDKMAREREKVCHRI